MFWGAKEFCPDFPKICLKILQKMTPKMYFGQLFHIKAHKAPFLLAFSGILRRFLHNCPDCHGFARITGEFAEIFTI